jgi:hypothetical protein
MMSATATSTKGQMASACAAAAPVSARSAALISPGKTGAFYRTPERGLSVGAMMPWMLLPQWSSVTLEMTPLHAWRTSAP